MKHTKYQTLLGRIDKHFEGFLDQPSYKVSYIKPSKLITYNRLDLAIKILYLRMCDYVDVRFAAELYEQHIKAEYLNRVHKNYMTFFKQQKKLRVLIVDANNLDFVSNNQDFEFLFGQLQQVFPPGITEIKL